MSNFVTVDRTNRKLGECIKTLKLENRLLSDVTQASVVILPHVDDSYHREPVFPSGTRELFRWMRRDAPQGMEIEVASLDQDYKELVRHADQWYLPIIYLAEPFVADIVVSLVASYLYDRLRSLLPGRTAEVESEILIQDRETLVSIRYKGPADSFESVIKDTLKGINRK